MMKTANAPRTTATGAMTVLVKEVFAAEPDELDEGSALKARAGGLRL
jgi:hypothetical protein